MKNNGKFFGDIVIFLIIGFLFSACDTGTSNNGEDTTWKKASAIGLGGMAALIDEKSKEYESQYITHLASLDDAEQKLLENPGMFKTPIVRNGKNVTVGFKPEIWVGWIKELGRNTI